MCDHGRNGRFIYPPQLPSEDRVMEFVDCVVVSSQGKIIELLDRHDEVEKIRRDEIAEIRRQVDLYGWDEWSEYFWTYLVNYHYTEVIYIEKWLKYWAKLYEISSKSKMSPVFLEKKDGITEDDIYIAKEYPIEELFEGELRSTFGRLVGLCPFHGEKTPSFSIFTEDNHFYCFGCSVWGDSIDFYMKMNKVSMIEAVKVLKSE